MLMAVVGADGAGKSTVSAAAADELRTRGRAIEHIDRWHIVDNPAYPSARFMRPDVPDTRQCVAEMPNPPRFLFLMWSIGLALLGRRATDAEAEAEAEVQVLDGYWVKHAASEVVYGLDRKWAENVVAGLPQPDMVVYLRITPEDAWKRKEGSPDLVPYECGMDHTCARESFLRHQHRIFEILDDWASRFDWHVVDANRPLQEVVAHVVEAVEQFTPVGHQQAGV